MRYVIAVSGGIDSVVLLDIVAQSHPKDELVVAHFEHGIRQEESKDDARFVEGLSKLYGIEFKISHGNLSQNASESEARQKRYDFLFSVAKEHDALLITAHHKDDLVETVILNLQRGTGWRGLVPMSDSRIKRPLLAYSKQEIREYALRHQLEWVEDSTNVSTAYTRNRIRRKTAHIKEQVPRLLSLVQSQRELSVAIQRESHHFEAETRRHFFTMLPDEVAIELLRRKTNGYATRPQLMRLLLAIKTARPGTILELGAHVLVRFTSREFVVELPEKVYNNH